jgi:hypothetical protein
VARIAILDPTAAPPQVDPDPGPDLGARTDAWCAGDGNRTGDARTRVQAELESFVDRVDAAVVGLGN